MNVALLLSEQARLTPQRPAIVDRSGRQPRTLTFAELDRAAARAAAAFLAAGLRPGDRVVVLHPMSADLYVGLAGLLRAGCVPTVCDPAAGRAVVNRCCALVRPRAIFAGPGGFCYALGVPQLARLRPRFACTTLPGVIDLTARHDEAASVARSGDDAAIVSFTSGSTGMPKVVVRSHALLRAQLAATRHVAPAVGIDIATMPIVLLANLAAGVTSVIPGVDLRHPGRVDAQRLADDIAATAATSIVASPAMLERLTRIAARGRLASLTTIVSGGAPVMPALLAALRRLVPAADVVAVYGSTEAEPIARVRATEIDAEDVTAMRHGAGLLAGYPVPAATVKVVSARPGTPLSRIDPLPAKVVGEIVVAGAHVVRGYLDGRGDAQSKVRVGDRVWHRTGDLGYFDERGRLWLAGRSAAAIADERGKLEPFAVETALSFDPAIARSAVARIDGRRVVAIEPLRRAVVDPASVRAALAWTTIDDIRIVRIPVDRRHNAKVDYTALGRRLGARA